MISAPLKRDYIRGRKANKKRVGKKLGETVGKMGKEIRRGG